MPLLPTFIRHRGTTKFKPKIFVLWPKGSPCRAQVVWPVGGDLWARAPFQVYADGRGMVWEERGHVQRWDLFFADLVKQDPGRARQNNWERARRNFTKPRTKNKSPLCMWKSLDGRRWFSLMSQSRKRRESFLKAKKGGANLLSKFRQKKRRRANVSFSPKCRENKSKKRRKGKKILKRRGSICRKRWNKRPRRSF